MEGEIELKASLYCTAEEVVETWYNRADERYALKFVDAEFCQDDQLWCSISVKHYLGLLGVIV